MNSIIEAQRELEEQQLRLRLLELRNLKKLPRPKVRFVGLVDRAMKMNNIFLWPTKPVPDFEKGTDIEYRTGVLTDTEGREIVIPNFLKYLK